MLQELRTREYTHAYGYDFAPQRIQRGYFTQPVVQSYAFPQGAFIETHGHHDPTRGHPIVGAHVSAIAHVCIVGLSESTCTVTFGGQMLAGNNAILIEAKPSQAQWQTEPATSPSPVLQMRAAHRSLAEKAQEELSEFERDYPW